MTDYLPKTFSLPSRAVFFGQAAVTLMIHTGLCIFVGPNGSGKSEVLRWLRDHVRHAEPPPLGRKLLYLSSGRTSVLESYRSVTGIHGPSSLDSSPAAVGHQDWTRNWWQFESATGMLLRLKDRPDLLLKVEARLQALYQRRLRLDWSQQGLRVGFLPTTGGEQYYANAEASGIIELVPLLAAIYDDEIGALLIDEPEISLHPQLQNFLLHEIESFAGDPTDPKRKLIVFATHSPTMLPIRRIKDVIQLTFFIDRQNAPIQIAHDTGELRSARLSALVARLSENHKLAFFARSVLLVEGPSDEIVVTGLALKLDHPLLASNTQVVPVTGKGQFAETVKLFRLMGKNVFVLADLDGLADDNQLVGAFRDAAQVAANACGMGSVTEIDRGIRDKLNTLLDDAFTALSAAILKHQYWTARGDTPDEELKAKRRATLAALFMTSREELKTLLSGELLALRNRYEALMDILATAGCVILCRGTIENYYFGQYRVANVGKPEAAAAEMEGLSTRAVAEICQRFHDVIRAIDLAAPLKRIDENELLREQLGSLLGAALQVVRPGMSDEELNARAIGIFSSTTSVFRFANRSIKSKDGAPLRRVEVSIKSPLFVRDNFPFQISEQDNITLTIAERLPST
jgi:hypothetical protein